jgi:hypothetical protein
MVSPSVAHELVITTADEKRFTIFRRVSKLTMSHKIMTRFVGYGSRERSHHALRVSANHQHVEARPNVTFDGSVAVGRRQGRGSPRDAV